VVIAAGELARVVCALASAAFSSRALFSAVV
jgi:hypothetical protein